MSKIYLNKSSPSAPISEMCKTIRKERYITQGMLAELISISASDISYIERGFIPSAEIVVALADLYKQTQSYQNQRLRTMQSIHVNDWVMVTDEYGKEWKGQVISVNSYRPPEFKYAVEIKGFDDYVFTGDNNTRLIPKKEIN